MLQISQNFINSICWPFNKCTRPIFAFKGIESGVKLKSIQSLQGAVMHKANLDLSVSSPNSQSIQIHPGSNRSSSSHQCIGKTPLLMPFILAKVGKSELIAVIPQIRADLSMHLVTFTLRQASKLSTKLDSCFHHHDMILTSTSFQFQICGI